MAKNARHLLLGLIVAIATVLVGACDRVKSLARKLKKSPGENSAVYSSGQVTAIDASSYDAFISQKNKLVIVDFYADWCGPCRQLAPILESAAAAHPGVVFVGRINVDQAKELAAQNQVQNIPDVRIFKEGRQVDRFVGCPNEAAALARIAALAEGVTPAPAAAAAPAPSPEEAVKPMPKKWMPPGVQKR